MDLRHRYTNEDVYFWFLDRDPCDISGCRTIKYVRTSRGTFKRYRLHMRGLHFCCSLAISEKFSGNWSGESSWMAYDSKQSMMLDSSGAVLGSLLKASAATFIEPFT